jgi:DNA-binding transcriptional ArsR family regulator
MAVRNQSSPFGSTTRTRVLIALWLLSESYPRELARVLRSPLSTIQKAMIGLERDGLIAAKAMGRTRVYRLEARYFAHADLVRYLRRLSEPETGLRSRVEALRRRPRRATKPL